MNSLLSTAAFEQEQAEIAAEAIGWLPLGEGAYLHLADAETPADDEALVITVSGVPDASMAGMNVLLLL